MTLSQLIERFVDLKIEGEPQGSEWQSIDLASKLRRQYWAEIEALKTSIDSAIQQSKG